MIREIKNIIYITSDVFGVDLEKYIKKNKKRKPNAKKKIEESFNKTKTTTWNQKT